jgi:hypothetical protein
MKTCSKSLVINSNEMPPHTLGLLLSKKKKQARDKCEQRSREIETLVHYWECKIV